MTLPRRREQPASRRIGRIACALAAAVLTTRAAAADTVVVYPSFSAGGPTLVEGRVIERRDGPDPAAADPRWRNLMRNMRAFDNNERAGHPVAVSLDNQHATGITDAEGYFRIELPPAPARASGWHPVRARSGPATATGQQLTIPARNQRGLISDLDDTILVTEVNDRSRMMKNTFLRNPAQREAVAGMASLYASVLSANAEPQSSPLFYLSASPRQLHASIAAFLELNRFPTGVLITRRITNDRTSDPLFDTMRYKIGRIEEILARVPGVRFLLVGDDGERDPEIYDRIRRDHPDRVEAIWIRRVHPDPSRPRLPDQLDLRDVLRETALTRGLPGMR